MGGRGDARPRRSASRMAMASAAPSTRSVPAPSSSSRTRLRSSEIARISMMLVIWEEKVESDCSMLCRRRCRPAPGQRPKARCGPRRDHQPALSHEGQKPQRFEGDRLAAGVRAGDDQRVRTRSRVRCWSRPPLRVDERMAGLVQPDSPLCVEDRDRRLHPVAQPRLGEEHIQLHRRLVALNHRVGKFARLGGQSH